VSIIEPVLSRTWPSRSGHLSLGYVSPARQPRDRIRHLHVYAGASAPRKLRKLDSLHVDGVVGRFAGMANKCLRLIGLGPARTRPPKPLATPRLK
jgi:hypothetical protein